MKIDEIMAALKNLSKNSRYYKRTYDHLKFIRDTNLTDWAEVTKVLEAQNFNDVIDLILYFEW